MCKDVQIKEERISSIEYIEFLKRTDLGSQYPKERFEERIAKLVDHVSISLVARNRDNQIVGVLFGLTDYAYWLYVTDLGVDRDYLGFAPQPHKKQAAIIAPQQPAENEAQKRPQSLGQVHQDQSHPNDAEGRLLQMCGNAAQSIGRFAGSEDAFHFVAVTDILIFLGSCLLRQCPVLGWLSQSRPCQPDASFFTIC